MVKIVVLEKEPSGQYQEYPDIAIFDDSESKEKMQLTSLDRGLLEVGQKIKRKRLRIHSCVR